MRQKFLNLETFVLAIVLLLFLVSPSLAVPVQVFYSDFNSGMPTEFSGAGGVEGVQGYDGIGTGSNVFSGHFLRNASTGNPAPESILTLTGLPTHDGIELNFLLAIIDSWDGSSSHGPDYFNVEIDGNLIFHKTFTNIFGKSQTYNPPPGVQLVSYQTHQNLWGSYWSYDDDSAYNMGLDPVFDNISHTSSTLTIKWWASGSGWQGGNDESWAIDNVEVIVNTPNTVPEPSTLIFMGIGLMGIAGYRRKRFSKKV